MARQAAYESLTECRICFSRNLESVIKLGDMALTGKFYGPGEEVPVGPLTIAFCNSCGLAQLAHSYNVKDLYSEGYGYRSSLNSSMSSHLQDVALRCLNIVDAEDDDIIMDIGSNDGTLLKHFFYNSRRYLKFIGVDPLARFMMEGYPDNCTILPYFFDEELVYSSDLQNKIKLITSIAMFYDVPDPVEFAKGIYSALKPGGFWVTEQAYLPSLIKNNAYDSICHEHLEYYTLKDFENIAKRVGFSIYDVHLSETNGGSFLVVLQKPDCSVVDIPLRSVQDLHEFEHDSNFGMMEPLYSWSDSITNHISNLKSYLHSLHDSGKKVICYGASTKGNVLLQSIGADPELICAAAEINEDKIGKVTPGTNIPIISDAEARAMKPDYWLVLPWHFRDDILKRERGKEIPLIFPLPKIEVIEA